VYYYKCATIEDQLAAAPQAMSNLANQIVAEHGLSGQVDFDVDNLQLTADVPEPIVLPPVPPVEPPSAELIPDVPAIALPEPLTTVAPVAAVAEQDIPF